MGWDPSPSPGIPNTSKPRVIFLGGLFIWGCKHRIRVSLIELTLSLLHIRNLPLVLLEDLVTRKILKAGEMLLKVPPTQTTPKFIYFFNHSKTLVFSEQRLKSN